MLQGLLLAVVVGISQISLYLIYGKKEYKENYSTKAKRVKSIALSFLLTWLSLGWLISCLIAIASSDLLMSCICIPFYPCICFIWGLIVRLKRKHPSKAKPNHSNYQKQFDYVTEDDSEY